MKFLVIGCNGMAGHIVSLYLKEQGHSVTGYARKNSKYVDTILGDATDFELLTIILELHKIMICGFGFLVLAIRCTLWRSSF